VQGCHQLESLSFRDCIISEEKAATLMKQLSIQRLELEDCFISDQVANVFVEALRSAEKHTFREIKLFVDSGRFRNRPGRWSYQEDTRTRTWKATISGEINKLTWSNHFKVDKDTFLHGVLGLASVEEKYQYAKCRSGASDSVFSNFPSISDDDMLWYCAVEAADKYDGFHKYISDTPSMLYSFIREKPEFFSQFIVHDRADKQMNKRRRV
jgi:hypothetical protein